MSYRSVIEHALRVYYGDAAEPNAIARELLGSYRAEVLAEHVDPANAQTIYADRPCDCDETPHPTWCPASVPTDKRIAEIRQGTGDPLTPRELAWLSGTAERHELHIIAARGGHWPLTDDPAGALLLVSQYLAAAVAVIERAEHVEEKATAPAATATPTAPADRIERYITALRDADTYALVERRDDLTRFAEAVIAVANDETDPVYRSGYETGFIHGGGGSDTNRRARLLNEMASGGRWKSGDVVRWYETQGLTGLGVRAARHDLAILRDSGAITQHDERGVRFYTLSTRKADRT